MDNSEEGSYIGSLSADDNLVMNNPFPNGDDEFKERGNLTLTVLKKHIPECAKAKDSMINALKLCRKMLSVCIQKDLDDCDWETVLEDEADPPADIAIFTGPTAKEPCVENDKFPRL